jgi:hypothetical protein
LKTDARLPGGSDPTIPGRYFREAIGSGATVIPLASCGRRVPAGAYPIEAALLEPGRGVISRHSLPLTLGP